MTIMREDGDTMTAWLSILVPVMIMFLALGMERVEARLRHVTVRENDVEELLQRGRPDEIRALFRQGISRALELFRVRDRRQGAPDGETSGPDASDTPRAMPAGDQLVSSGH